jgi:hypothetical protein
MYKYDEIKYLSNQIQMNSTLLIFTKLNWIELNFESNSFNSM